MIHQYKNNGYNIVLDVNSGAVHVVDDIVYDAIACMVENGLDTEITDTAKITYKSQTRSTLDKKRLEEDLGSLEEYTKVTEYSVLRIK